MGTLSVQVPAKEEEGRSNTSLSSSHPVSTRSSQPKRSITCPKSSRFAWRAACKSRSSLLCAMLNLASIDQDTLWTALDGATQSRKLKVEDVLVVETVLAALIPGDEREGQYLCPESVKTGAACRLSSSSPLEDVPGWFQTTKESVDIALQELPHGSQPTVAEKVETCLQARNVTHHRRTSN